MRRWGNRGTAARARGRLGSAHPISLLLPTSLQEKEGGTTSDVPNHGRENASLLLPCCLHSEMGTFPELQRETESRDPQCGWPGLLLA